MAVKGERNYHAGPRLPRKSIRGYTKKVSYTPEKIAELGEKLWKDAPVDYGYCWCGCGKKTPISTKHQKRGIKYQEVKGVPKRYLSGHWKPTTKMKRRIEAEYHLEKERTRHDGL